MILPRTQQISNQAVSVAMQLGTLMEALPSNHLYRNKSIYIQYYTYVWKIFIMLAAVKSVFYLINA